MIIRDPAIVPNINFLSIANPPNATINRSPMVNSPIRGWLWRRFHPRGALISVKTIPTVIVETGMKQHYPYPLYPVPVNDMTYGAREISMASRKP